MKKKIVYFFVAFSFIFSNFVSAESKEVPKISNEQASFKKKNWQPWVVAFVTLLVAGTGIAVVATHKGKDAHHK